jgi:hypothetical protein
MSPELDDALCKAHPQLFRSRRTGLLEGNMCWGFECGDGWGSLIASLCEMIEAPYTQACRDYEEAVLCRTAPTDTGVARSEEDVQRARDAMHAAKRALPRVTQVKEKFGGLRFYVSTRDARTAVLIGFAEHHSTKVCERCGAPGRLRRAGWLSTLCDTHAAESKRQIDE